MKLKKVHYISGVILTLFIGVHLFNHFMSLFGVETHIALMDTLRKVYRNSILEILLFTAVSVQIISGLRLFASKRRRLANRFQKLQIYTGLYLAFFLVIHVGAVLTGRLVLHLDTNFYFGVAGLNTFPLNLFFIPYYVLAILSFFGHIAAIHYQKMRIKILGITVAQQATFILILGVVISVCILYGLTNGFNGVEIPDEYSILTGK